MKYLLAALRCRVTGHNYFNRTPGVTKSAPLMQCLRCGKIGWLVSRS